MKLIICDGNSDIIRKLKNKYQAKQEEFHIVSDHGNIHCCIGCFGCWVKNPGECIIQDGYEHMGALLAKCDELIVISRCVYGWYSPFVKNVFDRSISYVLPDFTKRFGQMHHKLRYKNTYKITNYFYGEDITDLEKSTAKNLVQRNSYNLNSTDGKVSFYSSIEEIMEVLK